MNLVYKAILASSLALCFMLGLVGCEKEGPAEQAGKTVDRTVEEAGDKMEDVTDAATK
jgi:hypothetical protein